MNISGIQLSSPWCLYLRDVLGVQSCLVPEVSLQEEAITEVDASVELPEVKASAVPVTSDVVFNLRTDIVANSQLAVVGWNSEDQLYTFRHGPRGELLQRMLSAMQIPYQQVSYIEIEAQKEQYSTKLFFELLAALESSGVSHILIFSAFAHRGALNRQLLTVLADAKKPGQVHFGRPFSALGKTWLLTYDPQLLLDAPEKKRETWQQLKLIMSEINTAQTN